MAAAHPCPQMYFVSQRSCRDTSLPLFLSLVAGLRCVDVQNGIDLQEVHRNDRSCAVVSQVVESVLHRCRFLFNASYTI